MPALTLDELTADLEGIPASRLADPQELSGLLLAAANAAGLSPASPPVVKVHTRGVGAVLLCHGGHVLLLAEPEAGVCFVDVAGTGRVHPQRGLDVVTRRFGARRVRVEHRHRGAVATASPASPPASPTSSPEGA